MNNHCLFLCLFLFLSPFLSLAANAGKTIRVAYLRGSGRRPSVRSFALDKGQWGVGWDVKMDVGVKEMGFAGLHRSTGAG